MSKFISLNSSISQRVLHNIIRRIPQKLQSICIIFPTLARKSLETGAFVIFPKYQFHSSSSTLYIKDCLFYCHKTPFQGQEKYQGLSILKSVTISRVYFTLHLRALSSVTSRLSIEWHITCQSCIQYCSIKRECVSSPSRDQSPADSTAY